MRERRYSDGEWWLRTLPVLRRKKLPARTPGRYALSLVETALALGITALVFTVWLDWIDWEIYVTLFVVGVAVDARDYGGQPWRHNGDV